MIFIKVSTAFDSAPSGSQLDILSVLFESRCAAQLELSRRNYTETPWTHNGDDNVFRDESEK